MCKEFSVSWEIIGPDDEETGERDVMEQGSDVYRGLRDAVKFVRATRTNRVEGIDAIECDSHPAVAPRWVTVYNGMEYETGCFEHRSLFIPKGITRASARRIARLVGARV